MSNITNQTQFDALNSSMNAPDELLRKMTNFRSHFVAQDQYVSKNSYEKIAEKFDKYHISFSKEDILERYQQCYDCFEVADQLYNRDITQWEQLDNSEGSDPWFNSTILVKIIMRIVEENFDVNQIPDPHYILNDINSVTNTPKAQQQALIMNVFERCIAWGKTNETNQIQDLSDFIDMPALIKDFVKKCHHRDANFKALMIRLYDTFNDLDRNMYRIK